MISQLFMRLSKVHLATSREELDAIYRFRYTIYVEELHREIGGVDHARKMVMDAEDEKPYSFHLYIGSPQEIVGTVRVRVWGPGRIPEYDFRELSMGMFDGIESLTTAEMGRFMIKRSRRGKLILPSMARGVYEFLVQDKQIDLAFLYCRPGLVNHYRRLGARPFGGRMVDAPEGLEIPLVMVASDYRYFRAMKSPLAPLVKKAFGAGKRQPLDISRYMHLFHDDVQLIVTDPKQVLGELQSRLSEPAASEASFLEDMPEKAVRHLAEHGYIMDTPAEMLVTREGHSEREMYVILDGLFDVIVGDRVVRQLGKGDVFGEVAFFRESGQRSASVKAVRDGRIVTLRRKFLDELGRSDPRTSQAILFNLARILSERLADAGPVRNAEAPL
jgi:CRP-like cAMP-binding protein